MRIFFKKFFFLAVTIVLTLGLSFSLQKAIAAWQAPTLNPPLGDFSNFLNESSVAQMKDGELIVNHLGNSADLGLLVENGELEVRNGTFQLTGLAGCGGTSKLTTNSSGVIICGTDAVDDADNDPENEKPEAGSGISISGADNRTVNALDNSATNELQDLSEVLGEGNDAGGSTISNLGAPEYDNDAATRSYVDGKVGGCVLQAVPGYTTSFVRTNCPEGYMAIGGMNSSYIMHSLPYRYMVCCKWQF